MIDSFDGLLGETSLGRRLARVREEAEALATAPRLAVALTGLSESDVLPDWMHRLSDGRWVEFAGVDADEEPELIAALNAGESVSGLMVHEHGPGASEYIREGVGGEGTANATEVAVWGARGDRKTSASLDLIALQSERHRRAGYALPFRVMAFTTTFQSHTLKLARTLQAAHWCGAWRLRADGHEAALTLGGLELAVLDLFGAGDADGMDRLRMETHLAWMEECAPAALEGHGGISLDHWLMALTSVRLPTVRPGLALSSSNYPDEDHWAWLRFELDATERRVSTRIAPGESASPEDRARWAEALADRPDLRRRLIEGEPGSISQGPAVAYPYNAATHVAKAPLVIGPHLELVFGWDSAVNGHTHAVTIGARNGPRILVFAGLVGEETAMRQFLDAVVLPWIDRHARFVLARGGGERIFHGYDPAMEVASGVNIEENVLELVRQALGGTFHPGPVVWAERNNLLLSALNQTDNAGGMAVQIADTPATMLLQKSLSHRWHYAVSRSGQIVRDLPMKPNHPWEDLGDSFIYFLSRVVALKRAKPAGWRPEPAKTKFSVFAFSRGDRR